MQKIDLNPFRKYLISRIGKGVTNGQKLFLEIKDSGFTGSYETLYRYLRNELSDHWIKPYRKSHFYHHRSSINLSKYKRAIRFETGPGEQAQVDWGHFKTIILNRQRKNLYCFVFILCFSRMTYIEFTTSQSLPVFESCHINAFKTLGIPASIVYDNTKTAILFNRKTSEGKRKVGLNLNFFDFARYYGFEIIASPPYWPRNKGKVESGVKYIRNHFMQGVKLTRSLPSLEELNKQAAIWIDKVANNRIHATTKEKPKSRWLQETAYLKFPNGLPDYQVSPILVRFSTKDQFIQYKQNFYSVPKVLILDEISLFEPNNAVAKFLVELLLNRHLKSSTIFTSNKSFKSWGNAFGDIHTSAMVLDRITQRTEIIDIEGSSYRLKDRVTNKSENLYEASK